MTDHICPDTPQTRAAWSRVAAGLEALVWVRMEPQPVQVNPPGYWEWKPWPDHAGVVFWEPGDLVTAYCPVRPGDRVGWREEFRWTIGVYCPGIEFRDGTKRFPEFDDFGTIPPYWMDLIGWQPPATQPVWSIRRWAEVAVVDVGRPVEASEEEAVLSGAECRTNLSWTGATEDNVAPYGLLGNQASALMLAKQIDRRAEFVKACGDDAGLWWWKVKVKPTEKRA